MRLRLNIGCGDKFLPGFYNLDLPEFDATKRSCWKKFETGSIGQVNMDCVLPHIQSGKDLDTLIQEVARVLKPEQGIFSFSAPDWRKPSEGLQDVHHYRLIGPRTFWHYTREESVTDRPLEASGVWFESPKWKHRRVDPKNLEGYAHPIIEAIVPLTGLPIGQSRMTVATHWAIRSKARFALRSGRLDWRMKRNGKPWI